MRLYVEAGHENPDTLRKLAELLRRRPATR